MKIERVDIDGFGEYADKQLTEFSKPVTILYGPNEAGKSTLLAFVRAILFGFPLRGGADHFPPLAGGNHGGRLDVISDDGERFTIERYRGTRGGPVSIIGDDGSSVAESALARLLGHAPRSTFESVFAFDLDELQKLDSADDSGIGSQIYSAGTGASRLPQALKQLGDRADALYAQRGSKQPIAQTLAQLQELDSQLRSAQSQSEEYGAAVAGLEQIEAESANFEEERRNVGAEVESLSRTESSWDAWLALVNVRDRLAEIPELTDFPEDAISRLEGLELQLSEAENDVAAAETELERANESAASGIYDSDLLDEAKTIETIQLDRTKFGGFLEDLPKRQTELAGKEKDLARELGDLGAGWDEAKLTTFDTSVPQRDEVRRWVSKLADARDDLRSKAESSSRAADALEEATNEHQAALTRLESADAPPLTAEQIGERRAALRAARSRLAEYELAAQRNRDAEVRSAEAPPAQARVDSNGTLWPMVLGALGVLLLVAGAALAQWLAAAFGVALMVAAGGAWLMARRTVAPAAKRGAEPFAQDAAEDALKKRDALVAAVDPLALDMAIGEIPARDHLDTTEAALANAQESLRQHDQLQLAVDDASKLVDRRKGQATDAEHLRDQHQEAEERAKSEWRDWLSAQDLSSDLAPGTTLELMGIVETARAVAGNAEEMRERIGGIEREIDEYRARVAPLAERYLGIPAHLQPAATANAADDLVRRLADARAAATQHADALRVADDCEARLNDAIQRRTRVEEDVAALLSQGGTADAEELRRFARSHSERQTLIQDEREHTSTIRGVWGHGVDLAALDASFRATTREETTEQLGEAKVRLAELDEQGGALKEQRGELRLRMDQLSSDEETSRLRAHREELIEELRTLAREWSKLTIAKSMLLKARAKYEEERQPDVVRRAQTLFEGLTGGRYSKLHVTVGEQEITVIDKSGHRKTPAQLSRGTREQLYLALRFGLIQSMGKKAESLPVIVDEVLVNFDPERRRRAAEAFVELSRTNQVLVLTCHPDMRDLFVEATGGEATVIDLDDVRAAR